MYTQDLHIKLCVVNQSVMEGSALNRHADAVTQGHDFTPVHALTFLDVSTLSHAVLQGLVMLEAATGRVVVLASQVSNDSPTDPGSVINYANDLDIAQDGTVYFTTSSVLPVVPNAWGFWDTYATFTLTLLQVRALYTT